MQQAESLSLDEIESFLDGCGSVEFQAGSRADKYALVEGVLKRHHYADQKRSVKGLLVRISPARAFVSLWQRGGW